MSVDANIPAGADQHVISDDGNWTDLSTRAAVQRALQQVTQTSAILVGEGVLQNVAQAVRDYLPPGERVTIIADPQTWIAAGDTVAKYLTAAGVAQAEPLILGLRPAADELNVERVRQHLDNEESWGVAVGSGTINDLVKRASFLLDREYIVVATAPSMDGYAAFAAPITVAGFKTSLPCPAPRVVIADLNVLAAAPRFMVASGFGDLLGKIPSAACWLVAEAAQAEAIDPAVWPLIQKPLTRCVERPEDLHRGKPEAFSDLIEGLVLSGLTIQMYESSRPGSGMEHLLSHFWEMTSVGHGMEPPLSHGHKVGLGSIAAAAFYQELLEEDLDVIDTAAALRQWPSADTVRAKVNRYMPIPELRDEAERQSLSKLIEPDRARARIDGLRAAWPSLAAQLRAFLPPPEEFQRRIQCIAGPSHPHDVGMSLEQMRDSYWGAQVIRSRYTGLDLAAELGLMEPILDRLFAPTGFWGRQA